MAILINFYGNIDELIEDGNIDQFTKMEDGNIDRSYDHERN